MAIKFCGKRYALVESGNDHVRAGSDAVSVVLPRLHPAHKDAIISSRNPPRISGLDIVRLLPSKSVENGRICLEPLCVRKKFSHPCQKVSVAASHVKEGRFFGDRFCNCHDTEHVELAVRKVRAGEKWKRVSLMV